MSDFSEMVSSKFGFLSDFGYIISPKESENVVVFKGENNNIIVALSKLSYEITCDFIDAENEGFSLHDALKFIGDNDVKGSYELRDKLQFEDGINYISVVLQDLFRQINLSDINNFRKVYCFTDDRRKYALASYYLQMELKKADLYWTMKKYSLAREIFEKNIDYLSRSQQMKLEYIKKLSDK